MKDQDAVGVGDLAAVGARGGTLTLIGSGFSFAIQIVSLLTLSRLLLPADFGLVAMVAIFISLSNLLRDFGLPLAGLQEKNLSQQQASNLFWMNAAISTICALLLIVSTPFLVALFREPRLGAIVPTLALGVVLGGLGAQIQVQLARRLRYGVLVMSDVLGQILALSVAIVLAARGLGYWSLVAQMMVTIVVPLAWRWIASRWVPQLPRRGYESHRLLRTGSAYGAAQLLTFAQSNIDSLIIGAQLGPTALGYYSRGYQMLTAPAARFLDPLTQVVVPLLNRAKTAGRDSDAVLYKVQFVVGAMIVWVFAVTAGTAPGLIPLILGPHWDPVVPVFQLLAVGGAVWVFNHVSYWAFISKEIPRALLHYNMVSKPLAILSIFVGSTFGLVGVAAGYAVAMIFSWPLNLLWLKRAGGLSFGRFFLGGARIIVAGVLGGGAAAATFHACVPLVPILAVFFGLIAGTLVMAGVLYAFEESRRMLLFAIAIVIEQLRYRRRGRSEHAPD